ncbi:MAG: FAD-binding oxidoreductase [Rhodospirillaceae bacterium]|jgi:D-arginine dehydrogenase|nr:FAD-binding oxidoreductase [Rhodospirillaceae bacterium]
MRECDYLIIGAGIGGASAGYRLAEDASVIVVEREERPGYHTTGRSVAVYTEAYGPHVIRALAIAGGEFFTAPPPGFTEKPLCHPHGLMFVARADQRAALEAALAEVQELSPSIAMISLDEAIERVPVLRRDYLDAVFLDPNTMALDVDAIHQGYLRGLKARGGEVVCDAEVLGFERKSGLWQVETKAGVFAAPVVINAAGAWADVVAGMIGAREIGLVPKRRTVIAFAPPAGLKTEAWPVVFDTEEEFYFKADAGTILGSPADETPVPPQDAQPEELDIAITVDRLEKATTMEVGRIIRSWAGLRSFVSDGVPVVGFDPDIEGYFWCAGQGGYGIETSAGLSRAAAALARGEALPRDIADLGVTPADLGPERLWS